MISGRQAPFSVLTRSSRGYWWQPSLELALFAAAFLFELFILRLRCQHAHLLARLVPANHLASRQCYASHTSFQQEIPFRNFRKTSNFQLQM